MSRIAQILIDLLQNLTPRSGLIADANDQAPTLQQLLRWPLGEDNLVPRMHSQARKQWEQLIKAYGWAND